MVTLFSLLILIIACYSQPPNFLILFVDDLGYGDLGYNGHPTITTPNIDALALNSMRFTQWYSGFPSCSASRAAILTGRLPPRSGCSGGWKGGVFREGANGGLPTNETSFATILKKVGYATQIIGKWHLGQKDEYLPFNHGFDDWFGLPYSADMGLTPWDMHEDPPLALLQNTTILEQPTDLSLLANKYATVAIDFIKNKTAANIPWYFISFICHQSLYCMSTTL